MKVKETIDPKQFFSLLHRNWVLAAQLWAWLITSRDVGWERQKFKALAGSFFHLKHFLSAV